MQLSKLLEGKTNRFAEQSVCERNNNYNFDDVEIEDEILQVPPVSRKSASVSPPKANLKMAKMQLEATELAKRKKVLEDATSCLENNNNIVLIDIEDDHFKETIQIMKENRKWCNGCVKLLNESEKLLKKNMKLQESLDETKKLLKLKERQVMLTDEQLRLVKEEYELKLLANSQKVVIIN